MQLSRRRAVQLLLGMLMALSMLGLRLIYVQGVKADVYKAQGREQRLRTLVLPAQRGAIYDRNGRELAMSVPARTIYANPRQVPEKDKEGTARVLAPILGVESRDILTKLRRQKGFVYLARRIDLEAAKRVEALRLIGIGAIDESRRAYPGASLAANVLGMVGTDATGLAGLEGSYNELLAGKSGSWLVEQDPQGRAIPQGESREDPPVPGSDLVLTIDRDIQFAADAALAKAVDDTNAKGGTVVVMQPDTGEILAIANNPTFDPNDLGQLSSLATAKNRAVNDVYEPGSVNKVVTAAAALEEHVVSPTTVYSVPAVINVGGGKFSDAHGHATKSMTFTDIIAESSNVGTIKVALQVGPQRLQTYLNRFGYGRSTGLGLPGESSGILPSTERWRTSLPTMAIGQGLSVTALQMLRVFATIANDGIMAQPKLVGGWVGPDGELHRAPASREQRVISAGTASTIRMMLEQVVSGKHGTGNLAAIPGYNVAGKTGTAQKATGHGYSGYMASFVGMVPADNPRFVIGIVLEDPSPIWGGVVAAPVFAQVGQAALRIMRVPPTEPGAPAPVVDLTAAARDNDVAATPKPVAKSAQSAKPAQSVKTSAPAPASPGARIRR